jgi:hypothetical protein
MRFSHSVEDALPCVLSVNQLLSREELSVSSLTNLDCVSVF